MQFDARAAKLLKPGEHIVVDGCLGLRLVATQSNKAWIYRYKSPADGRMRQVKIGSWPAMPAATAAARWLEVKSKRDAGEDVAISKRVARAEPVQDAGYSLGRMVADYADGHLDRMREPKGAKAVRRRLERAVEASKSVPVSALTRRFVFDLMERLSATPVLARSVKAEMAGAWDYAQSAGRIPESLPNWWRVSAGVRLRSKGAMRDGEHKGTDKRVLSDAEIGQLFRQDMLLFSESVRDFLTLQMWTCTRGGEVAQAHADDFTEASDGWWWVIKKDRNKLRHIKSASDQRVPVVGRALEVVLRRRNGWLFPSTSRDGVAGHVQQAYVNSKIHYMQPYSRSRPDHVRTRLGVTHWSAHDLRRTGRTILASMGCPHEVGEAILGHVLPGVAGAYNQYRYDAERREWLTALSDQMEDVISAWEPPGLVGAGGRKSGVRRPTPAHRK